MVRREEEARDGPPHSPNGRRAFIFTASLFLFPAPPPDAPDATSRHTSNTKRMKAAERVAALVAELPPDRVRNIAIVAHVDAGKTTITDSLLAHAGLLRDERAGTSCAMMQREDEQERGVTIKSNSVVLPFEVEVPPARGPHYNPNWPGPRPPEPAQEPAQEPPRRESYLVNLTDTPGHVDFSSEVSAALRVTDGAVFVIEAVSGVQVQSKTVLRQALAERVRPVMLVNKVDRLFLEIDEDEEAAYARLRRHVEDVNALISAYGGGAGGGEDGRDNTVWPQNGTVLFASGLGGWGFSLDDFARLYCDRFGVSRAKMRKKLWGDNFWDRKARRWVTRRDRPASQERGFCALVLRPLRAMLLEASAREPDRERVADMLRRAGVAAVPPSLASAAAGGALARAAMQSWLPLGPLLARAVVRHLPSPPEAQQYRAARLYAGPQDDACAEAVRRCDPAGPLVVYVSKMVPAGRRFLAFGRVFSGTARAGQRVRVQAPGCGAVVARLATVGQLMISSAAPRAAVPAGSVVVLSGLEAHVERTATLVDADCEALAAAQCFAGAHLAVSPVVRVAVEPARASDMARMVQGLARLRRGDSLVQVHQAPTGEHIVAGAGELHLEVCLRDLRLYMGGGGGVRVSRPVVSYAEAVAARAAGPAVVSRSPNGLNRVIAAASALEGGVEAALEAAPEDAAALARTLAAEHGWSAADTRRVWAFGLPPDGPNLLVDLTRGVQYLHEARGAAASSFLRAAKGGALADEPVRGLRLDLVDAVLHGDSRHRNDAQLSAAVRNAFYAAQVAAGPALVEPVFAVEIACPLEHVGAAYGVLRKRRAAVCVGDGASDEPDVIRAHLPVRHSFGLDGELRGATSGHAFMQAGFSHWQPVAGDPLDADSESGAIVREIRKRKGMADTLPGVADFGELLKKRGGK